MSLIRCQLLAMACGLVVGCSHPEPGRIIPAAVPLAASYPPHPSAIWPWPSATKTSLSNGVEHWLDSSADGTMLDLLRFDFRQNPKLRFELYDQDEDDATPFDDKADYFVNGVGAIVRHLNEKHNGRVLAAWNGLYFAYSTPGGGPGVMAHHVGPVVIRGKARYNVGNHRWTFGASYSGGKPRFHASYLPPMSGLAHQFDFAASGAQMLINNGNQLSLEGDSATSAGARPLIDRMRTSRVSMAWSKDSTLLYVLLVDAPEPELESSLREKYGRPPAGGWTLSDLQRFWIALGAWGAVNSDGGDESQLAYLRTDGNYDLVPSRLASNRRRLTFTPEFKDAPGGGSLMTFYVIDSAK